MNENILILTNNARQNTTPSDPRVAPTTCALQTQ